MIPIHDLVRSICVSLITTMPDQGLEECLETLQDIYEFHSSPPSGEQSLPTVRTCSANVVRRTVRPAHVYPIE